MAQTPVTPGYEVDDDPARIDVDTAYAFLSTEAYWGRWRTREDFAEQVRTAWRVVGAFDSDGKLVGFARAVSDGLAIAYLADVYVDDAHRGHGLGVALVHKMIEDGPGREFRWMLHTSDAHGLYEKFGFGSTTAMERPAGPSRRPIS
ncbi:GNAT superfamily N-acetyltransferase [Hamadaea flava]|uniref:GNAT family N-acetyltransferase n=1 Tax=Hamadaea flava TaxID=1742688 RepID=A0ABV8LK30_9ACTN|nr:GNAT family N-acetyltransferase [Hamadaea flava]MCP2323765.1 GNAT superfamily N-acetyltransferase [Hamadaea flava]